MQGWIEVPFQEELLGGEEEGGSSDGIHCGHGPKRHVVAQSLGYDTSEKYSKSHPHVPRDEDGGVGGSALVVVRHIDGHVLECRPHVTVSQSDEHGRTVVAHPNGCGIARENGG